MFIVILESNESLVLTKDPISLGLWGKVREQEMRCWPQHSSTELFLLQITGWWYSVRTSASHSSASGHTGRSNGQSEVAAHACASMCDEMVVLWRLAVLDPTISPQRWAPESVPVSLISDTQPHWRVSSCRFFVCIITSIPIQPFVLLDYVLCNIQSIIITLITVATYF